MMNFKNCLLGIEIEEKRFCYLKNELTQKYDFTLLTDLLSLPCMHFETKHKLLLLFALLEDGEINDTIVDSLCDLLSNITSKLWNDFSEKLYTFVETQFLLLNRSQMLRLAHTVEIMYAKGYTDTFDIANLIYQRIPQSDEEFNPDSDDNIRIRLAKIAYSVCKYNYNEKFRAIAAIKGHLKSSGRKYLMGAVNYYKGLCLKATGTTFDFKDDIYYIIKSRSRGFELAHIYLDYRSINFETSRTS